MTYVFKRSRIAAAIVLLLTGAIIVMIWYRGQGRELYIPIIGSVLMAGIGYLASRLAANILSTMENTRYLGYLHMELDPKKFLSHYEGIPEKVKGSRITARSYLADGYWADGQFAKAIETFLPSTPRLSSSQKTPAVFVRIDENRSTSQNNLPQITKKY